MRSFTCWLMCWLFLAGCSGAVAGTADAGDRIPIAQGTTVAADELPEAEQEKVGSKRLECWVDLYRGEPIPFDAVLADLAGIRVIYLGERHGLARHHEIQRRIVQELAHRKVPLVLALEQMEAVYQPELDRYNRGEIDFDELAKATDWSNRWAEYESYRGVLDAARKANAPVLALNARRETIRQVARSGGVDKLDEATRGGLPGEMQLDDPVYEKLLNLYLGVHATAMPGRLRPMIEAQIARDEAMASVLSEYLKSEQGRGRTAVVLCGAMHCSYGLGTPARVRGRMPDAKERIILMSESGDTKITPAMERMARPITITHEQLRTIDRPVADYLHLISRAGE
ncbi:MAG: ChaN family lipoprotein [Pirellulaceae bacterium]|nr:ChaN family lipoprotein [Pirellulaceae bacterium]